MPLIIYANGQQESLALKELSITELYQFIDLTVAGKTPEIIALSASRNLDWVNSLSLDTFAELAALCFKANFPKAVRIADKDPIAGLKLAPFRLEQLKLLISANSMAFTPTPPPAAPNGKDSPTPPAEPASAAAALTS